MGKTLYLFSQGKLSRKANTLFYESDAGKQYVPVEAVDEIYVFGDVEMNRGLMSLAAEHRLTVHVFGFYDNYVGSFCPESGMSSGTMLIEEVKCYIEVQRRMRIARAFTWGAAMNILKILHYYHRRGHACNDTGTMIAQETQKIPTTQAIPYLMGIEATIRKAYYATFDAIVSDTTFAFEKRTKRPPENPMNALISFGNTVLYSKVLSAIRATHLDPRIGFLHESNDRAHSLNLDIAEIFKPVITDRTIFSLINKKMLTKDDFRPHKGGVYLTDTGKKKFIQMFEEKLNATVTLKGMNRPMKYKEIIHAECLKLENHIMTGEEYAPFVAEW